MKIQLNLDKNSIDINKLISRYHYSREDYARLSTLVDLALMISEPVGYYDIAQTNQIYFLMTLGATFDKQLDLFMSSGKLTEAYMLDCIGNELMNKAYSSLIYEAEQASGKFINQIDFLGDNYPLSMITDFFALLKPEEISYCEAFTLSPSKSVSFLASLEDNKKESELHICTNCTNYSCPHRMVPSQNALDLDALPKTYGNSVIFNLD